MGTISRIDRTEPQRSTYKHYFKVARHRERRATNEFHKRKKEKRFHVLANENLYNSKRPTIYSLVMRWACLGQDRWSRAYTIHIHPKRESLAACVFRYFIQFEKCWGVVGRYTHMRRPKGIYFPISSAFAQFFSSDAIRAAGADEYLTKEFSLHAVSWKFGVERVRTRSEPTWTNIFDCF